MATARESLCAVGECGAAEPYARDDARSGQYSQLRSSLCVISLLLYDDRQVIRGTFTLFGGGEIHVMAGVHHFSYGLVTPLLAYFMSFTGSLLGLRCTARARGSEGGAKRAWLMLGAVSIGGTGVWVMHFIAMLGFTVSSMAIRYNVPVTLLSALIAMVVVGTGLLIANGGPGWGRLLGGGLLTGLGVASMHYLGMAAMHLDGHLCTTP